MRTLVLNADYVPIGLLPQIHAIPAQDAVTRLFNETCHVVANYDKVIQTAQVKNQIPWPSVIARNEMMVKDYSAHCTSQYILLRDGHKCAYCGIELNLSTVTMDHVIPKSQGGQDEWENLVASCTGCNQRKADKAPVGEFRPSVRLYEPSYFKLVSLRRKYPITVDHESWVQYLGPWHAEVSVRA